MQVHIGPGAYSKSPSYVIHLQPQLSLNALLHSSSNASSWLVCWYRDQNLLMYTWIFATHTTVFPGTLLVPDNEINTIDLDWKDDAFISKSKKGVALPFIHERNWCHEQVLFQPRLPTSSNTSPQSAQVWPSQEYFYRTILFKQNFDCSRQPSLTSRQ